MGSSESSDRVQRRSQHGLVASSALSQRDPLDHGHRVASSALNDDCSPVDAVSNLGIGVVDERFHRFRPDTVAIDTQAVPGIDYTTD